MYASMIDDVCREKKKSVAFLCADSTPAFFESRLFTHIFSAEQADEYDERRKQWLKSWQPEALIVIDRWDMWEKRPFELYLEDFLTEVKPLVRHTILVSQVPVIRGGDANLRELIWPELKATGRPPRRSADGLDAFRRRTVAALEASAGSDASVSVIRADRLFYQPDQSVKYAEGRAFYYTDDDHLSDTGAELTRPLFEAALDRACDGSRP
jgi:hypothetical protein